MDVVQPALFAVMVSLGRVWASFGVVPAAVVGHSQGEIAAACVAGGLSLEDAARVVVRRAQLLARLSGGGGMVSLALSEPRAVELITRWAGRVGVATVNGPVSVTVSGELAALDELVARCEAEGVRSVRVAVDYASHSRQVEAIRDELLEVLEGIEPRAGTVPFLSTVTGELVDTATLDAGYWYRNLREPVRFATAIRGLAGAGHRLFVEVSPHPGLVGAVQDTLDEMGRGGHALGTLRRHDGGAERMVTALAEAWVHGGPVDWAPLFPGARRIDLPTYPFEHRRYWPTPRAEAPRDPAALGQVAADHPLLGAGVRLAATDGVVFTGRLSVAAHPWLADHVVSGTVVVPGTAVVDMTLWAARQVGCDRVDELVIEVPLALPEDGGLDVQIEVGPPGIDGPRPVTVHARPGPDAPWTAHAAALASPAPPLGVASPWPSDPGVDLDAAGLYERLAAAGLVYGPQFQGLRRARQDGDVVYAEIELPDAGAAGFGVHPALFDAALHALALVAAPGDEVRLPFAWTGVQLAPMTGRTLRIRLTPAAAGQTHQVGQVDPVDESARGAKAGQVGGAGSPPLPADGTGEGDQIPQAPRCNPADGVGRVDRAAEARPVRGATGVGRSVEVDSADGSARADRSGQLREVGGPAMPVDAVHEARPVESVAGVDRAADGDSVDGVAGVGRGVEAGLVDGLARADRSGQLREVGGPAMSVDAVREARPVESVAGVDRAADGDSVDGVAGVGRAAEAGLVDGSARSGEVGQIGGAGRPSVQADAVHEGGPVDGSAAVGRSVEAGSVDGLAGAGGVGRGAWGGGVAIEGVDEGGRVVISVEALVLRAAPALIPAGTRAALHRVLWEPLASVGEDPTRWAVLGDGLPEPAAVDRHADLGALRRAVDVGAAVPETVVVAAGGVVEVLGWVQGWLADERLASARLVVVTRGAVEVEGEGIAVDGLAQASVWGLVRSAETENPGRFGLVDLAGEGAALAAALGSGEAEVAVRGERLFARRLVRAPEPSVLPSPWRLASATPGVLDELALVPADEPEPALGPDQVRVAIHAAGLNFRDVLVALGMVELPGAGAEQLGGEGAGVVVEVGADVTELAVGDRVMGLLPGAMASSVVADPRMLVPVPAGWSDVEAASVPAVFLTAYHGLIDVAGLVAGESVLVHSAAGGVGMAALQLARWRGAEVYATASPAKQAVVRGLGVAADRIASSRDRDFADRFRALAGDQGIDVVLNGLAGDLVDASLGLLAPGGRFVEMGKTDLRDPAGVAAAHPGVAYRPFDLVGSAGPERIGEMLVEIVRLLEAGALHHLPVTRHDMGRARDAFRSMSQARHVGKIVLTVPG
ncbi:MAG TPA: acyltransferase domain-containing protein, partial [Acidimicrobiales bacterium]|nr:acyltransferase domain-containing protein [Acidimicrobiales bacterium]